MSEEFDLIVIGSGSAARHGAERASRDYGARAALIERERWGGLPERRLQADEGVPRRGRAGCTT